jgi:hypothetical protein
VGLPSLLSHRAATPPAWHSPHERDASHQSLQPTCCHEYPRSHAIPKSWALALPPAVILLVLPSGWEPSPQPEATLGDAGLPLLAPQPWVGHAVGAAPASCDQAITPTGMRGVPRRNPSGRCRPSSSPMVRLADAPCRCPLLVPGIPSSAARARTRFPASQPKGADRRARGAFHQQVPPSTPELAPERRPHGPPLVPWLGRQGPSFRHAFTPQPKGR